MNKKYSLKVGHFCGTAVIKVLVDTASHLHLTLDLHLWLEGVALAGGLVNHFWKHM